MSNTTTNANRIAGLDLYRLFACSFVIINHCNSKVMFQLEPMSLAWLVTVAVVYITKVAVPGFLMIAGYNLLHKQDDWKKSIQRTSRILIVTVFFSVLYYIWRFGTDNFFPDFFDKFWHAKITDAFWYLYMYFGLMLVLPFLQKLCVSMKKEDFKYFFAIALVFTCILPTFAEFIPQMQHTEYFEIPVVMSFGGSVAYMFIGHYFYSYIVNKDNDMMHKIPMWLPVFGFAVGFILNMIISVAECRATGAESYLSMEAIEYFPLMLESICAFTILLKIKYSKKISNIISSAATLTFGVYLISDFICTQTHFIYYNLCMYMNRLFAVAIQDICAIAVSLLIVWLIRRIPLTGKYI